MVSSSMASGRIPGKSSASIGCGISDSMGSIWSKRYSRSASYSGSKPTGSSIEIASGIGASVTAGCDDKVLVPVLVLFSLRLHLAVLNHLYAL